MPAPTKGLRHVALWVTNYELSVIFYTKLLGMSVEWEPDVDNIYLTSGNDNLALHRLKANVSLDGPSRLDHIGFILGSEEDVQEWYTHLSDAGVKMKTAPRKHRDGASSFYCLDPDNNTIQMIYHPPIAHT